MQVWKWKGCLIGLLQVSDLGRLTALAALQGYEHHVMSSGALMPVFSLENEKKLK